MPIAPDTAHCDGCGKEMPTPDIHVLPDGWERDGYGNDICSECTAEINEALSRFYQKEFPGCQ